MIMTIFPAKVGKSRKHFIKKKKKYRTPKRAMKINTYTEQKIIKVQCPWLRKNKSLLSMFYSDNFSRMLQLVLRLDYHISLNKNKGRPE